MAIRVLIADDHPMVRQGLRTFLELHADLEIIGEASDGPATLALCRELQPDVLLLDVMMPGLSGTEVLAALAAEGLTTRVLILTSQLNQAEALRAVELGASGFLTKDIDPQALAEAVRAVHRGEPQLHPEVTKGLMQQARQGPPPHEQLTEREFEVLLHIAKGLTNRGIAEQLFISEKTVKTHISNILDKLGLHDRTQAALYAVRHKLVEGD